MENVKNGKNKVEGDFAPSTKLVAGAKRVCIWKPENQIVRVSSAHVISWIKEKKEFTRGLMEKALGLNTGQAEWHIKELIKKGIIKRTKRVKTKTGKGQRQVIYKFI